MRCAAAASVAATLAAAVVTVGPAGARPAPARHVAHQPPFVARVRPLTPAMQRTMTGVSWRPGCPVALERLRLVRMRFWGFDRRAHRGRLIVNAGVARAVVRAFAMIYRARFPIRRMQPVDAYGGSDDASMAADNTSAFNCRPVTGTGDRWSTHSYGRAVDVDTIENPYVKGSTVLPSAGRRYLRRGAVRRGMIVRGSVVTGAFAAEGFHWGGDYRRLKDYQHFERVR